LSTTVLILVVALALAAAGAVYQAVASRRSSRRHAPPGSFVDAGGYRLHVVCAGTGAPPVVFEAGIAASSLSWTRVLPEVARFTSSCAYDRAGLGWSETPGRPRRFADVVRDLHTVLVTRGFAAPCVLVGHSFGCFIVCAYAAAHRQDVGGLVLIDPPAASEWQAPSARQARMIWGGIQLSRVGALLATLGVVRACGTLVIGGTPGPPRAFLRLFGPTAASTVERLIGEIGKLPAEVYPLIHAHWAQPKCFQALADHLRVLEEGAASRPEEHRAATGGSR
jgi:pimeloyl-ACP methyl ester carboxylesterase